MLLLASMISITSDSFITFKSNFGTVGTNEALYLAALRYYGEDGNTHG